MFSECQCNGKVGISTINSILITLVPKKDGSIKVLHKSSACKNQQEEHAVSSKIIFISSRKLRECTKIKTNQ